jgi:hypothetical protein
MSIIVPAAEQFDAALTTDVITHLDAQLVSARRLLQIVLEQGAAIRARDVQQVVSLTGMLQAELQRRALIERDRARLLERAGARRWRMLAAPSCAASWRRSSASTTSTGR